MRTSIYKTISYRLIASITTGTISLLLGLPFSWAISLTIIELIIKPLIYFIHEEVWEKIISK